MCHGKIPSRGTPLCGNIFSVQKVFDKPLSIKREGRVFPFLYRENSVRNSQKTIFWGVKNAVFYLVGTYILFFHFRESSTEWKFLFFWPF